MPRRKDNDKIDEILSTIQGSLKNFTEELKGPLASWLRRQNIEREDILKKLTEARTKASELRFIVEDLEDSIKDGRTNKNSRFASNVVKNFLERTI